MKSFFAVILIALCAPMFGQTPTYDDLVFDEEEVKTNYKPLAKSNVVLKSKKGTDGMPKVPAADAIIANEITDIILVFTETNEDAANTREESNRERWENLISAYPAFFQFNTNYKNICQCVIGGDAEALKPSQGFYVYYKVPVPKAVATPAAATPVKEEKTETKTETNTETKEVAKVEKKETKEVKETKKVEDPVKEVKKEVAKEKEVKKEEKVEEKEEDLTGTTDGPATTSAVEIAAPKKKPGFSKPKRAKDAKACRPPFYGTGDEDLITFFKDNIVLTKKQRRQVKGDVSILKLSLNFDGSIKKALVNGANTSLNEFVSVSVKSMDSWNPAVKSGLTVKSEVKISLRYDKSSHAIKPFEVAITPRPNPKCMECKSDSEIFGD